MSIVGIGLIGGSIAMDLRSGGFGSHFIGVDSCSDNVACALSSGIVDEVICLDDAIGRSDLIVLATPVDVSLKMLPNILDKVDRQVVVDVSSVKSKLAEVVASHSNRGQFVSMHPMAGTEYSGPEAAQLGLFNTKKAVICDAGESSVSSVRLVEKMLDVMNMSVVHMDSATHDKHVAYISHLSNISSFAMALTALKAQESEPDLLDLASTGFESTVRLASSSADTWTPIISQNADSILASLDDYISVLSEFRENIKSGAMNEVSEMISEANKMKKNKYE